MALLHALQAIESENGRLRAERWGDRTLDLDIIDFGARVEGEDAPGGLALPHPRAAARAFVLAPLREVAPTWIDPATSRGVGALWAALPETGRAGVTRSP